MANESQDILTRQERSRAWWGGAIGGAVKGIPTGILLGVLTIGTLFTLALCFPALGIPATFGSWLFTSSALHAGGAALASLSAINPIPIIVFNAVLTSLGNLLTGGSTAVKMARQDKENQILEAKVMELDGRQVVVEQAVVQTPKVVESILARGANRSEQGFAAAEQARAADTTQTKSLQ